jgi:hypothetical protein
MSGTIQSIRNLFVAGALVFFCLQNPAYASGPAQLSAVVQKSPAQITLIWPAIGSGATIYRTTTVGGFSGGGGSWGAAIATLPGTATSYTDANVTVGTGYEYRLTMSGLTSSNAYIYAGVELPLVESRGKLVLLVDDSFTEDLASEFNRLQKDLAGDGWTVIRHDVSRTNTPPNIKAVIKADYAADTNNVASLLLLGHIPIPYSGWMNPDGHGSRPAPTDTFYGDMHGIWTDVTNKTSANPPYYWWVNKTGDGKYDQNVIPADVDLQVGRVDFYDMPAFQTYGLYEVDLLRRYLNKAHDFRTGALTASKRGATMTTTTGDYCMSEFFGAMPPDEIAANNYFSTFESNDYLWFTKGTGGGTYDYTAGIGATTNFAASTGVKVVFNSFFASYFWEWDVENAFLRAPLAAKGYGLVNMWSDNPCWVLQHMALGKTVGFSARVSQNNNTYYNSTGYPGLTVYRRGVHMSLMGDPTLRMHVVAPPARLTSTATGSQLILNWMASPDTNILGYNVYRATVPLGPFTRLNSNYVTATTFTDASPPAGPRTYMVRAVKVENSSGSGSYLNASQGVFNEQGPKVLAADDVDATTVKVIFDKPVDPASAQNAGNYLLNYGIAVSNAILQADGQTVLLNTSPQADGITYILTINNVADLLNPPNVILTNTHASYLYSEVKEYVPDANTIALWHLNGDGVDASGNENVLVLNGNAGYAEASPVGPVRQCLQVHDVGDYASASIPAAAILPGDGSGFTIEARIFVNAWKGYGVANSDLISAYQDYNAFFRYDQGLWDIPQNGRFDVYNANLMTNTATQPFIPLGKLVHIAVEFDGTNKNYVYIDKVLRAGPVTASPIMGNTSPFAAILGNFDGYIDEVRLSSVMRNFVFDAHAPANLTATAISPYQVNLSWLDVPNESGFKVERWDGGTAGFVQIAVTRLGATTFRDFTVAGGTQYYYRVRAFNATGDSEYSAQAGTATPPVELVGTPPKLTARELTTNGFLLHIDGTAGVPFSLQASSNLFDWLSIFSSAQGGQVDFTDSDATNYPFRFYRTSQ